MFLNLCSLLLFVFGILNKNVWALTNNFDTVPVESVGPVINETGKNLIVSTIDGQIFSFDAISGEPLWNFSTGPLFESSLPELEVSSNGKKIRIIPSLDGSLFKFDGNKMEKFPVSVEALLGGSYKLGDAVYAMAKIELSFYGINTQTGEGKYICTADNCDQHSSVTDTEDILIFKRTTKVVRAINSRDGSTLWHFRVAEQSISRSIGSSEFKRMLDGQVPSEEVPLSVTEMRKITVAMAEGFVGAVDNNGLFWSKRLNIPVTDAWILNENDVKYLDLFNQDNLQTQFKELKSVLFLGLYGKKLYIKASNKINTAVGRSKKSKKSHVYIPVETDLAKINLDPKTLMKQNFVEKYANGITFYDPIAEDEENSTQCLAKESLYPSTSERAARFTTFTYAVLMVLVALVTTFYKKPETWKMVWNKILKIKLFKILQFQIVHRVFVSGNYCARNSGDSNLPEITENISNQINPIKSDENSKNIVSAFEENKRLLNFSRDTDVLENENKIDKLNTSLGFSEELSVFCYEFLNAKSADNILSNTQKNKFQKQDAKNFKNATDKFIDEHKHNMFESNRRIQESNKIQVPLNFSCNQKSVNNDYKQDFSDEIGNNSHEFLSLNEPYVNSSNSKKRQSFDACSKFDVLNKYSAHEIDLLSIKKKEFFNCSYESEILFEEKPKSESFTTKTEEIFDTSSRYGTLIKDVESNSLDIRKNKSLTASLEHETAVENASFHICTSRENQFLDAHSRSEISFSSRFFQDFKPIKCLGSGGFGIVFKCSNVIDDGLYAVKRTSIRPKSTVVDKVKREVKALAKLSHPHIVRYYTSWIESPPPGWQAKKDIELSFIEGNSSSVQDSYTESELGIEIPKKFLYIQMELCQEDSLHDWLLSHPSNRNTFQVLEYFFQITSAVTYVHESGLIHRDLKPKNIFFSLDGSIKVGDFGLVSAVDEDSQTRTVADLCQLKSHTADIGTELYMSPEVGEGKPYNYKIDIYALGLILYELFCPFGTEYERTKVLLAVRSNQFQEGLEQLHPEIHKLISDLIATDPNERPSGNDILRNPLFNFRS